jgi:hypothetical protein
MGRAHPAAAFRQGAGRSCGRSPAWAHATSDGS